MTMTCKGDVHIASVNRKTQYQTAKKYIFFILKLLKLRYFWCKPIKIVPKLA